jgi:nucleotide-binding universal stress UspA family protein
MKILVPVDGSAYTKRMLGYLAAHDEWLGGNHTYTVFHCVPAVPSRAAAALEPGALRSFYDDEAEKVFKPIRAFFGKKPGLSVTFVSKSGPAPDNIAAMAERGSFDLIVMGSHGKGSLTNLIMGSVATKVLAHCKVPVLLVR